MDFRQLASKLLLIGRESNIIISLRSKRFWLSMALVVQKLWPDEKIESGMGRGAKEIQGSVCKHFLGSSPPLPFYPSSYLECDWP